MALRNRPVDRKLAGRAPVATSPDSCESALPSAGAGQAEQAVTKPAGQIAPPALKKLLTELATLCWF